MSAYPTPEQVEAADAVQLLRWHRFLPVAGMSLLNTKCSPDVYKVLVKQQSDIINRIQERLEAFGGITPEISKLVGGDPRG